MVGLYLSVKIGPSKLACIIFGSKSSFLVFVLALPICVVTISASNPRFRSESFSSVHRASNFASLEMIRLRRNAWP